MAVSNAFGSNVFNVFMGLGLPWFLYCFFAPQQYEVNKGSHTYHGLSAEGVVVPTLTLLVLLVIFVMILAVNNCRLYPYHAYFFIATYVLFLVWAVGWQCYAPFEVRL
jgi:Ca2+/Na+ antiporter